MSPKIKQNDMQYAEMCVKTSGQRIWIIGVQAKMCIKKIYYLCLRKLDQWREETSRESLKKASSIFFHERKILILATNEETFANIFKLVQTTAAYGYLMCILGSNFFWKVVAIVNFLGQDE